MIKFTIPGEPKAKARHRITKRGFSYTPKETVEYENWVKQCYLLEHGQTMLEGQINAHIKAYFGIPKSYSKKQRRQIEEGKLRPTKKPDTDNIAKAVLDSLNGIAYRDDSAVVSLTVEKLFDDIPRIEVILSKVNKGEKR
jgi:Holliday junction resolvase RusA-like endonuclease